MRFLVHCIDKKFERKPNCLFLLLIKINELKKCVGGLEIDRIDFVVFCSDNCKLLLLLIIAAFQKCYLSFVI